MSQQSFIPGGIELSEKRLREIADALHGPDPMGRRNALRLAVEGFVTIKPVRPGDRGALAKRVGVYDLSRTGIAVVDDQPIPAGAKFNVVVSRAVGGPIELLCTARHSRRQGDAYITGAEFGVSWLAALGAAVAPPKPSAER
jgi:hypothetical protein